MWHIGIRCVVGLIVSFFLNFVECNSVWTSEKGRNAEMFRYRTAISSQVSGCPQQDLGYRIMNHKLDCINDTLLLCKRQMLRWDEKT